MTDKPRPKLKPLNQRPEPTPPSYPLHWYDDNGNIILIPCHALFSAMTVPKLKRECEKYRIVEQVKGDKREAFPFLAALTKERYARYEAKYAVEAYRVRLQKWRIANDYNAA